ncbi:glycosyltransferase [Kitasatospora gansuensis]
MNGTDRRAATACPCPAARDSLCTPVHVVELDLAEPGELRSPGGTGPATPDGCVLALVRLHGHPLGLVTATGSADDPVGLRRALVEAAFTEIRITAHQLTTATIRAPLSRVGGARSSAEPPHISVVIATHNRPELLRQCLDSVLRIDSPQYEVLVVDSAPAGDDAKTLIRERYADRVRYLREPVAGLARAHNVGLAAARGELIAFTDDDTLVDRHWLAALATAFADDPGTGCVTGLILPAELQTAAQAALHRLGGYDKGFVARRWSLAVPPGDPLFPFTAGSSAPGPTWPSGPDCCARWAASTPPSASAPPRTAATTCWPSSGSSPADTCSATSRTRSSGTGTAGAPTRCPPSSTATAPASAPT